MLMMMICAGGCSGFLPLCHCFHPLPYILYVASGPTDGYIKPIDDDEDDDDDDDDGDEDDATTSYPPLFQFQLKSETGEISREFQMLKTHNSNRTSTPLLILNLNSIL